MQWNSKLCNEHRQFNRSKCTWKVNLQLAHFRTPAKIQIHFIANCLTHNLLFQSFDPFMYTLPARIFCMLVIYVIFFSFHIIISNGVGNFIESLWALLVFCGVFVENICHIDEFIRFFFPSSHFLLVWKWNYD